MQTTRLTTRLKKIHKQVLQMISFKNPKQTKSNNLWLLLIASTYLVNDSDHNLMQIIDVCNK